MRDEFIANPIDFMSKNGIKIAAAGTTNPFMANPGTLTGAWGGVGEKVELVAPSGVAEFAEQTARVDHPYIKCGVPVLSLSLVDHPGPPAVLGAEQIPVYVIPYWGGKGVGVKLPTGPGPAYAITTKIDGCTFSVSGTRQEPYCGHSNMHGVARHLKSTTMEQHINMLNQLFRTAEGPGHDADVDTNSAIFNYFPWEGAGGPDAAVNYMYLAQQRVRLCAESGSHFLRSKSGILSKDTWDAKLSDRSAALANEPFAAESAVIGIRTGGAWAFYFNTFYSLEFVVRHRRRGLTRTTYTTVPMNCVLTYGEIWPNQTVFTKPFFPDAYDLSAFDGVVVRA